MTKIQEIKVGDVILNEGERVTITERGNRSKGALHIKGISESGKHLFHEAPYSSNYQYQKV